MLIKLQVLKDGMLEEIHHRSTMKITDLLNSDEEPLSASLKAPRKRIGPLQSALLQSLFARGVHFPDRQLRVALGQQLGLTGRTVQVWFQNRRQQMKSTGLTNPKCSEEATDVKDEDEKLLIATLLQSIKYQL